MTARRRYSFVVSALVVALLASCGSDDDKGSATGSTTTMPSATTVAGNEGSTTSAPSTSATTASGSMPDGATTFNDRQYAGTKVTVLGSIRDAEAESLAEAWKPFEDATGIDIDYEGSGTFEDDLKLRVDGGNAPDLAFVPQPGLFASFARDGKLVALSSLEDDVAKNDIGGWLDYGTVDGKFYGPPFSANIKSLVWYSPSAFAAKGYKVPTTWQEMLDLSDKIAADGGKPWCVGAESGGATGWVLTDWVEDVMLRTAGPETYDKWVAHEIPFDDPAVVKAVDAVGAIVKNDHYVLNGAQSIPSTDFKVAGLPILDGDCYLHRQASFYASMWPKGTTIGADGQVNAFFLPMEKASDPKTMLGGGELIAAFSKEPAVEYVAAYLSSAEYANSHMALGGRLFPLKNADTSLIKDPVERQFADLLVSSDVFRYDGSDLMPGAVGSGTFWTEIVEWVAGGKSTAEALKTIDQSWPKD